MANGQRRRGVSKYSHLLDEDDTFRAWYRNVLRGSYATGSVYLLRLGRLCELCRVTPRTIASMNKVEPGISGITIGSYLKAIKSWGRFNGTRLDERISLPDGEPLPAAGSGRARPTRPRPAPPLRRGRSRRRRQLG